MAWRGSSTGTVVRGGVWGLKARKAKLMHGAGENDEVSTVTVWVSDSSAGRASAGSTASRGRGSEVAIVDGDVW